MMDADFSFIIPSTKHTCYTLCILAVLFMNDVKNFILRNEQFFS
jgi:hypothetical protein